MNRKRLGIAALVAGVVAVVRRRMRTVADPGVDATLAPQQARDLDASLTETAPQPPPPAADTSDTSDTSDGGEVASEADESSSAETAALAIEDAAPEIIESADPAGPEQSDEAVALGDPEITLPPAPTDEIKLPGDPNITLDATEPAPGAVVLPAMPLAGSTTVPNPVLPVHDSSAPAADSPAATLPADGTSEPAPEVHESVEQATPDPAPESVAAESLTVDSFGFPSSQPIFAGAQTPPAPDFGELGSTNFTHTRPSPWSILGSLLLAMLVTAVIAASFIKLPYYRLEPGSVYDTIERVEAPGDLVFLPDGQIGFVTVAQTANITPWQWLDAKLDDSVRIRHEDEVRGDQTADELRQADLRRMQVSKSAAVVVALQRLGFELIVTPIGIEVAQVFPCTAAEGTLGTGDLIVGVNGVDVRDGEQLVEQLIGIGVGQDVELLVERIDPNNPSQSMRTDLVGLTLGSADDGCLPDDVRAEEPRPFIGIGTLTIFDEDLPVDVDIRTGRVGGPSAGIAFTLAIIDVLSEGELTNGMNIVATGSIDREGNVGPVGGIHQKTVAAERAGADVFIVPKCCDNFVDRETGEPVDIPSNYEEALEHAEDMIVIGVDTLDEALLAIGELGGDVERFLGTE